MQNYALNQYQKTQVTTVDSGKVVVLLYEGAINFLRKSQEGIVEKDIEKRHNNLMRALDIIDELNNSLNFSEGGEIAISLRTLYDFMYGHLTSANIKNDPQMIQEAVSMLSSLKDAWEEVASNPEINRPEPNPIPTTGGIRI